MQKNTKKANRMTLNTQAKHQHYQL